VKPDVEALTQVVPGCCPHLPFPPQKATTGLDHARQHTSVTVILPPSVQSALCRRIRPGVPGGQVPHLPVGLSYR
jgi:hypothetical protein